MQPYSTKTIPQTKTSTRTIKKEVLQIQMNTQPINDTFRQNNNQISNTMTGHNRHQNNQIHKKAKFKTTKIEVKTSSEQNNNNNLKPILNAKIWIEQGRLATQKQLNGLIEKNNFVNFSGSVDFQNIIIYSGKIKVDKLASFITKYFGKENQILINQKPFLFENDTKKIDSSETKKQSETSDNNKLENNHQESPFEKDETNNQKTTAINVKNLSSNNMKKLGFEDQLANFFWIEKQISKKINLEVKNQYKQQPAQSITFDGQKLVIKYNSKLSFEKVQLMLHDFAQIFKPNKNVILYSKKEESSNYQVYSQFGVLTTILLAFVIANPIMIIAKNFMIVSGNFIDWQNWLVSVLPFWSIFSLILLLLQTHHKSQKLIASSFPLFMFEK